MPSGVDSSTPTPDVLNSEFHEVLSDYLAGHGIERPSRVSRELVRWTLPWAAIHYPKLVKSGAFERIFYSFFEGKIHKSLAQSAGITYLENTRSWIAELHTKIEGLSSVEAGQGDPHKSGRSVCEGTLLGSSHFLKYQQVDLSGILTELEHALQSQIPLSFPGAATQNGILVQPRIQFIEHPITLSTEVLNQLWRNIGFATAVLDFLNFTDGHYENIYLDQNLNVLVMDTETLLSPRESIRGDDAEKSILQTGLVQKADSVTQQRVTSPLLPQLNTIRRYNFPYLDVNKQKELTLRFTKSQEASRGFQALGVGTLIDHVTQFCTGLRSAYHAIRTRVTPSIIDSLCTQAVGHHVRIVFNSTRSYRAAQIELALRESRQDVTQFIANNLDNYRKHSVNSTLITDSEVSQLLQGDIPSFYADIATGKLSDGLGNVLGLLSPFTPIQELQDSLRLIDDAYIDRQCAIIENQVAKFRKVSSNVAS